MNFQTEQIISWNRLGQVIEPVLEQLETQPSLVVFHENEPKLVLLTMEQYESLVNQNLCNAEASAPAQQPEKIGAFIRRTMKRIFQEGILSQQELEELCDREYCRRVLHQTFPVLKLYNPRRSKREQKMENGYLRYYDEVLRQGGKQYLLSNHWIEARRPAFLAWLNGR